MQCDRALRLTPVSKLTKGLLPWLTNSQPTSTAASNSHTSPATALLGMALAKLLKTAPASTHGALLQGWTGRSSAASSATTPVSTETSWNCPNSTSCFAPTQRLLLVSCQNAIKWCSPERSSSSSATSPGPVGSSCLLPARSTTASDSGLPRRSARPLRHQLQTRSAATS